MLAGRPYHHGSPGLAHIPTAAAAGVLEMRSSASLRYGAITQQRCHAVALQNCDRFLHRNAIAGTPERQWQMPF